MTNYLLPVLMWLIVLLGIFGVIALVQISRHIDRMLREDEERN